MLSLQTNEAAQTGIARNQSVLLSIDKHRRMHTPGS